MDNTFLREAIEKIEELTDSAREPHSCKKDRRKDLIAIKSMITIMTEKSLQNH